MTLISSGPLGLVWCWLRQSAARLGAGSLLLVMVACGGGGGGGGGGSGAGSGSAGSPDATPSLVPAAPALGEVLYADATVLRPAAAGMRWTYAGLRTTGAVVDRYDSDVQIEAAANGALTENGWQVFEGSRDASTLMVSNGTVTVTETIDLGAGSQSVSATELRSPVRANDQTVVLERMGAAMGVDIDGDKKSDTADLAFYRRVIGNEDVELPALGRTVRALRVDDVAMVRFHRSSDGGVMAPITTTGSTWYAPGIGIVRRTLVEPPGQTPSNQYDERLQAFDGLTTGVGALMYTRPNQPELQGLLGQTLVSAAAVGDRVLVLSRQTRVGLADLMRLAVLDASGRVLSSRALDGVDATLDAEPVLVGSDGQALLLIRQTAVRADPYVHRQVRAWRLDRAGQVLGPADGTVLALDDMGAEGRFKVAGDGTQWWMLWVGAPANGQSYPTPVQLQAFDATSLQAATPRYVLEAGALFGSPRALGLAVQAGRVVATWQGGVAGAQEFRVAQLTGGGQPLVSVLGPAMADYRPLGNANPIGLLPDGRAVWFWNFPAFTSPPVVDTVLRGVVLGADGVAVRTTAGGLDSEVLPTTWAAPSAQSVTLSASGSWLLASAGYAPWQAADATPTPVLQVAQISSVPAGLAAATPVVQRWRAFDTFYGPGGTYGTFSAKGWVALKDRVMVLGDDLRTVGLAFLN